MLSLASLSMVTSLSICVLNCVKEKVAVDVADGADDGSVHGDRGRGDALDQGEHGAIVGAA